MPFQFPAFVTLRQTMGLLDSALEANELGLLELIEKTKVDKPDNSLDLAALSAKHRIKVNATDKQVLRRTMHQLYIVNAMSVLESYVEDLTEQHPDGASWKRLDKEDDWTMLTRYVGGKAGHDLAHSIEFKIVEHYRLFRNAFMHDRDGAQNALNKDAVNLKALVKVSHYTKTDAPNAFHDASFDDFILLTRAGKVLAKNISAAMALDASGLALSLKRMSDAKLHRVKLPHLKRYKLAPVRQQQAVETLCNRLFNLTPSECVGVYEELLKGPLA